MHKQEGTHAGTGGMVTVFSFPGTRSLKPGKSEYLGDHCFRYRKANRDQDTLL